MINLIGIELKSINYSDNSIIGTLLFNHYPTTIVLTDRIGNPIIKEWVDSDANVDRFFYYTITKWKLKKFIEGNISHLDMINSSLNGILIFEDVRDGQTINAFLIPVSDLPINYKPSTDFFFKSEDGVDVPDIIQFFRLNELQEDSNNFGLVKSVSTRLNSETLYIHLNNGRGVGTGRVNTELFGTTLLNFDKFYKNVALDHVLGSSRGDIYLDAKKNEEYLQFTDTEVYGDLIRASFGFLIRPIKIQLSMFEATETEKIAARAFNLLQQSEDLEALKSEYLLHSSFTITSFTKFLQGIIKYHLKLDLNWYSPYNLKELSYPIDYIKANKIIIGIDNLSAIDNNEFRSKGRFRAVNCDTGHYNFVSLGEQQFSGYFDDLLLDGLVRINFVDIYDIKVSRTTKKEPGKAEAKISDVIISCIVENESGR